MTTLKEFKACITYYFVTETSPDTKTPQPVGPLDLLDPDHTLIHNALLQPGLYAFFGEGSVLTYIGRASSQPMIKRLMEHFRRDSEGFLKDIKDSKGEGAVSLIAVPFEKETSYRAASLEACLVQALKPPLNHRPS